MSLEIKVMNRDTWHMANNVAQNNGCGWRLPTRHEVNQHASTIRANSQAIAKRFIAFVWTSEICEGIFDGGAVSTNGKVVTTNDGKPLDIMSWAVDVIAGRESKEMKSALKYVVLVRETKAGE